MGKENSSHFSGWGRVERGGGETFTAQDRGSGGSARAPSCEAGPTEEGDITGPSSGPGQILELLRACFPTSLPPLRQARRALPLEGKDILSRPGPLPTKGDTATPQAAVAAASPGINICGVMERLGPGGAGAAPSFPLTTASEPPLSTLVPSWHNSHGGGYYRPGTSLLPARTWGDPAWTRRDPAGSLHRPGGWVPSPAPDSTRPALRASFPPAPVHPLPSFPAPLPCGFTPPAHPHPHPCCHWLGSHTFCPLLGRAAPLLGAESPALFCVP